MCRLVKSNYLEADVVLLLGQLATVPSFDEFRLLIKFVRVDVIRVNLLMFFFLAGCI